MTMRIMLGFLWLLHWLPLSFTARLGEAIGSFAGSPLYHASLDADEYRALLARNGFILLRHVGNDPACGGATIWLARREG